MRCAEERKLGAQHIDRHDVRADRVVVDLAVGGDLADLGAAYRMAMLRVFQQELGRGAFSLGVTNHLIVSLLHHLF